MNRYHRQSILPAVGEHGQHAIESARVLIVGAGGLGSPVLQYLVGAGVGHVTIVDGDIVSESNLHRQTFFTQTDVGRSKALTAAQRLNDLNPTVFIEGKPVHLDTSNAHTLVQDHDVILDCADSFAVSYILSDACLEQVKPLITASVLGFEGYVAGFCGGAPSLRAVFPDLPDRAATCATAGVMGPVVGMLGSAQAQMALALLIGQKPSPLGQFMRFDLASFRSSQFRFDGAPEPEKPMRFIGPGSISPDDFVVELREVEEAPQPVFPSALRLNVDEFKSQMMSPEPGQRAIFTCRSGLRAWQAASHLRTFWDGEITLIAMGDVAQKERQTP